MLCRDAATMAYISQLLMQSNVAVDRYIDAERQEEGE